MIKKSALINFFKSKFDFVFLTLVILYSLIIWWPTRIIPYHWDSAGFVVPAALNFLKTNFSPFIAPFSDFAHPPLFIASLAIIWKLFGESILVSHIFNFIFLPILLFSTYLIGKKINDLYLGISATLLLAVSAIIITEYGIIYIDLPMAAVATAATAAWFYKKNTISSVLFLIAFLYKFPAILVLTSLLLYELIFNYKNVRQNIKQYFIYLLPYLGVFAWLGYHYQIEGWLLKRPQRNTNLAMTGKKFYQSAVWVFNKIFANDKRILITLGGLGSGTYLFYKDIKNSQKLLLSLMPLIFILLSGIIFFAYVGEFGLRYGIFLLPSFYLIFLRLIQETIKNNFIYLAIITCVAVLFINTWHPKIPPTNNFEFSPQENLSYQDIITIGQGAAYYLESKHFDAKIYGSWPEIYQLMDSYQGYVSKPLSFLECKNFIFDKSAKQIIYAHLYSPGEIDCINIIKKYKVHPLSRFESNGKWLELYLINASESAKLLK